jgi:hypothetical protein
MDASVKLLAFYLPQFHPIPENDEWWGNGFTEWTNVRRAIPMYKGHHQPEVPAELGYYDLRDPGVQIAQAELAKQYGIHGFCYYYYWFSGRRLLEAPLESMRLNKDVDIPYCLCWANENWTRRWDGLDQHVLMEQSYSEDDDVAFARSVTVHFNDDRYIRVDGKPLLLVYRTSLFPDMSASVRRWRNVWRAAGVGEVYLVMVETGDPRPPEEIGFDAACEFPPHPFGGGFFGVEEAAPGFRGQVKSYPWMMTRFRWRPRPKHKLFRGVCPSWDQTPRRMETALSYFGSSPELYKKWLSFAISDTLAHNCGDERIVFVNAWNEWGEGAHLEPCGRYGRRHLEATAEALADPSEGDWEIKDRLAATLVAFSISASSLSEDQLVESVVDFASSLPEDLETAVFLRFGEVERDDLIAELSKSVWDRVHRCHDARGALAKVVLLIGEDPEDYSGAVVKFPAGYQPRSDDFRHWWMRAVVNQIEREMPGCGDRLTEVAERVLGRARKGQCLEEPEAVPCAL